MSKTISAIIAVLAFASPAIAFDAPEMDQIVMKMALYHMNCAPLTGRLLEVNDQLWKAMTQTERTRAAVVVSEIVAGHMAEFCKVMKPSVDELSALKSVN